MPSETLAGGRGASAKQFCLRNGVFLLGEHGLFEELTEFAQLVGQGVA